MTVPYFFKQIIKRRSVTVGSILLCAVFAFGFLRLEGADDTMAKHIDGVYDNLPVQCTVTNAAGTRQSGLDIPSNKLNLFLYGGYVPTEELPERGFQSYVTDLLICTRLECRTDPADEHSTTELYGLTGLEAVPDIHGLQWRPGVDGGIFSGEELWCVAPRGQTGTVSLYLPDSTWGMAEYDTRLELTVVGNHAGKGYYAPWGTVASISTQLYGKVTADSISATIADNRAIDTFRALAAKDFVQPGQDHPESSKELGLTIYDETLYQTLEKLEQNRLFLTLALAALLAVSFGVGLVFSFLTLRHRLPEMRLQHLLGVIPRAIFVSAMAEQGLLCALGIGLGTGIFYVLYKCIPASGLLLLFWCVSMMGALLAWLSTTNKDFWSINERGE